MTPPAVLGAAPQPDPGAPARYRAIHAAMRSGLIRSAHDVSEGGLAVALAELVITSGLGLAVDTLPHDDGAVALFAESIGRLVLEVAPDDVEELTRVVGPLHRLGVVTDDPALVAAGARAAVAR